MDALCKRMFIIIENMVNIMKTRHVSKVVDVFHRTWKKKHQVHITSFFEYPESAI